MQKGQIQIILIGILVVAVVVVGAFYLAKQTTPKPSPAPVVSYQTPQPTSVPIITDVSPKPSGAGTSSVPNGTAETANWKTYTNTKGRYSFKYPDNWTLDERNTRLDINNNVTLSKDSFQIFIWANLEGIGGNREAVSSTPIVVGGLNLYEREREGTYEIGSAPDEFAFDYNNKKYDILFSYPVTKKDSEELQNNLEIFHKILSTFIFQ